MKPSSKMSTLTPCSKNLKNLISRRTKTIILQFLTRIDRKSSLRSWTSHSIQILNPLKTVLTGYQSFKIWKTIVISRKRRLRKIRLIIFSICRLLAPLQIIIWPWEKIELMPFIRKLIWRINHISKSLSSSKILNNHLVWIRAKRTVCPCDPGWITGPDSSSASGRLVRCWRHGISARRSVHWAVQSIVRGPSTSGTTWVSAGFWQPRGDRKCNLCHFEDCDTT